MQTKSREVEVYATTASAGNLRTCGSCNGTISTMSGTDTSMHLIGGMFPTAVRKVTRMPRLPETSVRVRWVNGLMWLKAS
jgi:hypothetical protein